MTFRPSVLPDRDNDILSTFTRSFEQARQLVRADQASARAQGRFDLEQREGTARLDEMALQAALDMGTTPGLTETTPGPGGEETIEGALGAGGEAPAVEPVDPGADLPDFEIVLPGGRTFTMSPEAARQRREATATAEDVSERSLPSNRIPREQLEGTARALIESGIPSRGGEPLFSLQDLEDGLISPQEVIDFADQQRRGEEITGRAITTQEMRSEAADAAAARRAEAVGIDDAAMQRVNPIFDRLERNAQSTLDEGVNEFDRLDEDFEPPKVTPEQRVELFRQAIRQAHLTGAFGDPASDDAIEARDLALANAEAINEGGPPEDTPSRSVALGPDELANIVRSVKTTDPTVARRRLEAAGFPEAQIRQVLAAITGGA